MALDFSSHFQGISFLDGRYPERNVFEYFSEYPSKSKHHTGTELRIASHAGYQFPPPFHQFLHQDGFVGFRHPRHCILKGSLGFLVITNIQEDEPLLGLMGQG